MKTKYKYIKFEWNDLEDYKRWECFNKITEDLLGWVNCYERRKKPNVIEYSPDCEFDESCTLDIAHFLGQLNKRQKQKSKADKVRTDYKKALSSLLNGQSDINQ